MARFSELTLENEARVLRLASQLRGKPVHRLGAASLHEVCERWPNAVYFEHRSMFSEGGTYSYSDLILLDVKKVLVRWNHDRDLISLKVG